MVVGGSKAQDQEVFDFEKNICGIVTKMINMVKYLFLAIPLKGAFLL